MIYSTAVKEEFFNIHLEERTLLTDIIVNTVHPERIYLFGSYAKGTPTSDCDYDFYVVMDDQSERPLSITRKIRRAFGKQKTHPVDLLVSKKSTFDKRSLLPSLERVVIDEGVLLYG